ncbi:hypothetical protein B0H12DRAFT_1243214 [Mycena haematopus]|nr:hypothetical protein B0H12DRAFT_1243214 [Mycena haematopus]
MSGPRVSWSLNLVYFFAVLVLAVQSLDLRSEQTQAQCSSDYDWASNSLGLTPCLLTARIGMWPQLSQGQSYTNPNSTTANLCTCSWAAYNLISACTACQGFDSAVENWAAYDQSCGGFLTSTYFPANVTLPKGTAIPFWAGTDPTTWNDGRFNTAQAQLLAEENKPDYVQGQSNPVAKKSKPPVGAIVGGVIGGVAVLIIGGIAFWLMRKRNQKHPEEGDLSGKSILGHPPMSVVNSQRPGTIYTTAGTMHTHNASVHSLSYGSGYSSPVRPMSPPSPPQTGHREDHIEPFTLRPTSPPASMSIARKTSGTTLRSTETPAAVVVHERYAQETSERARLNPPPYSPSASVSPASSPEPTDFTPQSSSFTPGHRTRREKVSVDTQTSYDSGTSHGGGESVSAIDEVIGRMGLMMSSPESAIEGTMGAHTVSTGESANILSHLPHKANVSNPDNDPHD